MSRADLWGESGLLGLLFTRGVFLLFASLVTLPDPLTSESFRFLHFYRAFFVPKIYTKLNISRNKIMDPCSRVVVSTLVSFASVRGGIYPAKWYVNQPLRLFCCYVQKLPCELGTHMCPCLCSLSYRFLRFKVMLAPDLT